MLPRWSMLYAIALWCSFPFTAAFPSHFTILAFHKHFHQAWLIVHATENIFNLEKGAKIMRSAWKKTPDKFGGVLLAARSTTLHYIFLHQATYLSLKYVFLLKMRAPAVISHTLIVFFFCLKRKMQTTTSALKFASAHNQNKVPPDRMRSSSQVNILNKNTCMRRGSAVISTWAAIHDVAKCTSSLLILPCTYFGYNNESMELRGRFRSNFNTLEACR